MSDQKFQLKTGQSLRNLISSVIEEGVKSALHKKSLQEKEKQQQASSGGGSPDDLFGTGDSSGGGDDEKQEEPPAPSKTVDSDQEAMGKDTVEPKDIVDKLNSIRSGKSFKDESVSAKMQQYIESLTAVERTALLAFLKGIAQIVTGEIEAQTAVDPGKDPADVKMKKGHEQKVKHITPNVIKSAPVKKEKTTSAEDTSGPVPITPKRR